MDRRTSSTETRSDQVVSYDEFVRLDRAARRILALWPTTLSTPQRILRARAVHAARLH